MCGIGLYDSAVVSFGNRSSQNHAAIREDVLGSLAEDGLQGPKLEAGGSVRISWDFLCGYTNLTRLAGVGLAHTSLERK